jgi:hypothetical protein
LSSVICHLPSAIGYWLLAIGYWLLAIGYVRSARLLAMRVARTHHRRQQ